MADKYLVNVTRLITVTFNIAGINIEAFIDRNKVELHGIIRDMPTECREETFIFIGN